MVGLALIINGLVVSKKIVEAQERALKEGKASGRRHRALVVCDQRTRMSSFRRILVLRIRPRGISKTSERKVSR